ncbi:uncharacterized protein LOC129789948 [Lutzomyia longipalpis]|uniref:uncharacterized protein LOC129789948 n=1 Tax=Lutzomyia longipalpis TaxID=7200 RepID=UPI00248361B4|nr:uncharacterized protein LOC129789948 [Lutzomyia longipalpis]
MRVTPFVAILSIFIQSAFSASVSPKLDFASESMEEESPEMSSKFYGVHVIVDTSKLKRTSDQMSDENREKNEKTIGIRTDITFEIPAKKPNGTENVTKSTENESSGTGEDDGVPIFKGRDSDAPPQPKPRDWKPLFLPNNYEGFWTTERSFFPRNRQFHQARMKPPRPFVPYMIGQNEKVAVKPIFKPCHCDSFESDASFRSRSTEEQPPFGNIYFVPKEASVDDKLDGSFKVH